MFLEPSRALIAVCAENIPDSMTGEVVMTPEMIVGAELWNWPGNPHATWHEPSVMVPTLDVCETEVMVGGYAFPEASSASKTRSAGDALEQRLKSPFAPVTTTVAGV